MSQGHTQGDAIGPLDVFRHERVHVDTVQTPLLDLGGGSPIRPVHEAGGRAARKQRVSGGGARLARTAAPSRSSQARNWGEPPPTTPPKRPRIGFFYSRACNLVRPGRIFRTFENKGRF